MSNLPINTRTPFKPPVVRNPLPLPFSPKPAQSINLPPLTRNDDIAGVVNSSLNRLRAINQTSTLVTAQLSSAGQANADLRHAQNLIQQMQALASQALKAPPAATATVPPSVSTMPPSQPTAPAQPAMPTQPPAPAQPAAPAQTALAVAGPVGAYPTGNIGRDSIVQQGNTGMKLSITSDNGQRFVYTLSGGLNTTTWGQVADAFNAANMGVTFRFDTSNPGAPRMAIESTDGTTGFRIDGWSAREVVDDLSGMQSAYDGAYSNSKFTSGMGGPVGFITSSSPAGMTFDNGAAYRTAGIVGQIPAGSSINFTGSDGVARTWTATSAAQASQMVSSINAMGSSVVAEYDGTGAVRLRDRNGALTINSGTGAFDAATGALKFAAVTPAQTPVAPIPAPAVPGPMPVAPAPVTPAPVAVTPAPSPSTPVVNNTAATLGQQFDAMLREFVSFVARAGQQAPHIGLQNLSAASRSLSPIGSAPINSNLSISKWGAGGDPAVAISALQNAQNELNLGLDKVSARVSQLRDTTEKTVDFFSRIPGYNNPFGQSGALISNAQNVASNLQKQLAARAAGLSAAPTNPLLRMLA